MNIDNIDFEDFNIILRALDMWTMENADDLINGPFEDDNDEHPVEYDFIGVTEFGEDVIEILIVNREEAECYSIDPYTLLVSYEDLQMYVDIIENIAIEEDCIFVGE
jgi:hypothetical protein